MGLFSPGRLQMMLLSLPGIIIAITFHEIAHGYAAESMGDMTARNAGRLSLNPLAHLDPIGVLSMVLFGFGWARPVPVNSLNFRNRRKGIILVSLSGCIANLVLGFVALFVLYLVSSFANPYLYQILYYLYFYNIVFAVFNLIPIPPLDGSQILYEFLPYKGRQVFERIARYGWVILLLFVWSGVFSFIISPIVNLIGSFYNFILGSLFSLF